MPLFPSIVLELPHATRASFELTRFRKNPMVAGASNVKTSVSTAPPISLSPPAKAT